MSHSPNEVRGTVRQHYGKVADSKAAVGCAPNCCSAPDGELSRGLGYTDEDLNSVPEGSNMGLGCGNPTALAMLAEGEVVLDLGSGGGFDCFLAAKRVGPTGRVIGVDMTPEMISKARANADKLRANNVEFRLGEIEHLPAEDSSVDVILSNCVLNLSPEKKQSFAEAFRVLKPGGRIAISDVVLLRDLPDELAQSVEALTGCISGAARSDEIEAILEELGFEGVAVNVIESSREIVSAWMPDAGLDQYVASATIEARKPVEACCAPSCCG